MVSRRARFRLNRAARLRHRLREAARLLGVALPRMKPESTLPGPGVRKLYSQSNAAGQTHGALCFPETDLLSAPPETFSREFRKKAKAGNWSVNLSDERIIEKVLAGDTDLYEEIVRRYQRKIVVFLQRIVGNHEAALDLSQEIFLKVYLSLHRFDPKYRFSTWFYRVTSNAAIDFLRKKRPPMLFLDKAIQTSRGETHIELPSPTTGPDRALQSHQLGDKISRAIDRLPLEYREPIVMRHILELSYREIAEITRLPLGTVKNRIFRGREQLKRELQEFV